MDVDNEEEMLIVQSKKKKQHLLFYRLRDYDSGEERTILKKSFFKLKFQHEIRDFYFLNDRILQNFDYKSFLIISTAQNFIIYRESKRKIIKKIFALPNHSGSLKREKFQLMY